MEGKEAKSLLEKRLYLELQIFRQSLLQKSKREIYDSAYKIEVMETLFGILLELIQDRKEDEIYQLLGWHGGILELIYQKWLKKDDSFYEELSSHTKEELTLFMKDECVINNQEDAHGKRVNQAA